ncbi:MAG: hypothetical protein K9I85_15535 [Saprospiraceae bacterium]|nr:hypothetical protein [Saprospiraceae bacterium]
MSVLSPSWTAFLSGSLLAQFTLWLTGDLVNTALTGFVGAFASYLGLALGKRIVSSKRKDKR